MGTIDSCKIMVAFLLTNPFSDLVNPDCLNLCVSWNENQKIDRATTARHRASRFSNKDGRTDPYVPTLNR